MPAKYIGEVVEIVYMDKSGNLTQRRIEVHFVRSGLVYSTCLSSGARRTFREDRILACRPSPFRRRELQPGGRKQTGTAAK
ncbi:hypothetical protein QWJ34_05685 [Saccharibacillus sp. CPCC 101409]|uniref:hypothetical protein n=1 Tax=Saccharibacillus sp. CPCC 101409 TaxID=3058041 RepID=UPI002673FE6C|nr:hypothetical protein [Saccharibacillus sp. CPCC 101409]MDO3409246.1 hypothetical protein [Saccharibacillus sp. CPCC 101409]